MSAFDTHGTEGTPRGPRPVPRLGYLWAFGLALLVAVVIASVSLGVATYGAFVPSVLLEAALGQWLGQLTGVLLLVLVLTAARWWGVTGLTRLAPQRDGWTVLPLLGLVVLGAVVGWVQYGRLLTVPVFDRGGATETISVLWLVTLFAITSVLLTLALVPRLLDDGRSPLEIVLMTGVVVGLSSIGTDLVFEVFSPDSMGYNAFGSPSDTALRVLAQALLVLPYVAVAIRTGSPWLLFPVLLIRLLTGGPGDAWFWAYALLGAAYAAWLAWGDHGGEDDATDLGGDQSADSEVPTTP